MSLEALSLLSSLVCLDAAHLGGTSSRLLRERDACVQEALAHVAATLPAALPSEDERTSAWALLIAYFARHYRAGEAVVRSLPDEGSDTWLEWRYRGQHALGEGPCWRNDAFWVGTATDGIQVRLVVEEVTCQSGERGVLVPLPDGVRRDETARTVTLPFACRAPTADEHARWGSGQNAQHAALRELMPRCLQGLSDVPLSNEQWATRVRAFVRRQWADRFHPVALGPLLEAWLDRFLSECADSEGGDVLGGAERARSWQRILACVRASALTLIEALARACEPERRLALKRPFVVRTDWLVPIRHVPRALWADVLANDAQLQAWKTLYGMSPRWDEQSLEEHPTLVVDTRHFTEAFTNDLLAAFPDRDEAIDGVLVHAENYRALRFLEPTNRGRVRAIVIDPPYATGNRGYPYRDVFSHESWLTMMEERLRLAWELLDEEGVLFVHIDDHQVARLGLLLDEVCGEEQRVGIVVWHRHFGGSNSAKHIATTHEYILVYARHPEHCRATVLGQYASDGRELLDHSA